MDKTKAKSYHRSKAIVVFCRQCYGWTGDSIGTTWVKAGIDVRECDSKDCPLWYFRNGKDERPGRTVRKLTSDHREKFLRANKNNGNRA